MCCVRLHALRLYGKVLRIVGKFETCKKKLLASYVQTDATTPNSTPNINELTLFWKRKSSC